MAYNKILNGCVLHYNVNHSFKIVVWSEYATCNYLEFMLNVALLAILLLNWSILGLELYEAS